MLHTDSDGRFRIDSMIFFDKARILFTDIRGKKSRFIEVSLDGDSLNRFFPLPEIKGKDFHMYSTSPEVVSKKMQEEYEAVMKAKGIMLGNVTVTGHKQTKLEEFEEKYVSGLFAGDPVRKVDLLEEDLTAYRNIFEYLQFRVPGLQVMQDGFDYILYFRQQATVSSMGNIAMALFLDETLTDASVIATIPANQVAMVKVFSTFAAASGGGPGGALAIYTKRGDDLVNAIPSAGDILSYKGYSVIKEFYSPDYKVKPKATKPDNRTTLYWNPTVFMNGVNPSFPVKFFNNDRTRQFKVVVEGMTTDGKMLMIEKLITAKKAF